MQHGECYDSQGCTELQKSINYLTFSGTTVSTSIRFPRSSLPRLVNLAHTAVLECCTSTRVLNLVPLLNLALTWYSSTSTGGPMQGVRCDIFKPKLFEPHLYRCACAARASL